MIYVQMYAEDTILKCLKLINSAFTGKGLKTKTYGVIIVQQSLVHPFAIFPFQRRHKCREAHYHKNDNKLHIEIMNQS